VGFELTTRKKLGLGVHSCQEALLQHIFIAIKLLVQLCNGSTNGCLWFLLQIIPPLSDGVMETGICSMAVSTWQFEFHSFSYSCKIWLYIFYSFVQPAVSLLWYNSLLSMLNLCSLLSISSQVSHISFLKLTVCAEHVMLYKEDEDLISPLTRTWSMQTFLWYIRVDSDLGKKI
jgi:hypothetical protein